MGGPALTPVHDIKSIYTLDDIQQQCQSHYELLTVVWEKDMYMPIDLYMYRDPPDDHTTL